jgi:hypothetical protein
MTCKAKSCVSASFNFGLAALFVAVGSPLIALGQHEARDQVVSPKLVQIVREATAQYVDVNNAAAAGYGPVLGCVSGPDHGAMGVHYVNGNLINGQTLLSGQNLR